MRRVALGWVLVVVIVSMTACGASVDGTSKAAPAQMGGQSWSSCPAGFAPLELIPETPQESALVGLTVACGDLAGRTTYLSNRSDAVWVIDSPAGLVRTDPGEASLQVQMFRRLSTGITPGLSLEPNTSIYVSLARGQQLHMTLDAATQSMWHTGDMLGRRVLASGRDAMIKATTRGTPTGFALATCFAQGYEFGKRLTGPGAADGYSLGEYLGFGRSVQKCGAAIGALEQDATRTGVAPAASVREAAETAASPRFAGTVRTTLTACLTRAGALLRRI